MCVFERADEDSASRNTRSSLVANSPPDSSPKTGVTSTLPAALISRTPAKSFEKEGFLDPAKSLVGISDLDFKSQHGGSAAEKSERDVTETSETTVKQKDDDANNSNKMNNYSAKDLNLENKVGSQSSKDDVGSDFQSQDMSNCKSVLRSENNFQVKELTVTSDGKEENDDFSKMYPPLNEDVQDTSVIVHTSGSLYANNADIKRFLSEQKSGVSQNSTESAKSEGSLDSQGQNSSETVTEPEPNNVLSLPRPNDSVIVVHATNSLYANDADIKRFLCEQEDRVESSSPSEITSSQPVIISERSESSIETTPNILEFPETWSSEDVSEICDQVSPLGDGDNWKVTESSKPAVQLRDRSGSIGSIQVDSVLPEPVEVELEADFVPTPIPDLPHPLLDSNRSSAFVDILSFLSDKMKNDSFSAKQQQPGCAVECLKHFLHTLDGI